MRIDGTRQVVIGGAGLIGSHTVDELLLEDVAEVFVFDNFIRGSHENLEKALKDPRVKIVEGDITHPNEVATALKGADGVFHFAALWLLHCEEDPRDGFDVNLTGTFNVLQACSELGMRRLVFSSSASVYGDAVVEPMDESHPFNNTTIYGATKIGGEAMASAFHHRDGLNYVGLRYFNVYGPRQDYNGAYVAVIMKMLDALDRSEAPVVFGDGTQAYDFISVRDCARANVAAMKAEVVDRCYNVCTGTRTALGDLAEMLIQLTGRQVDIDYHASAVSFVRNRIGDPTAAMIDLGFVADTCLSDGLRDLIAWRDDHRQRWALD
ncbi:MAG: SDR family NAD(P)-dependent oxidoreductase [Acidimicrobiales bacterium]|jgi:UDP-glucose 4-epimerase|nr:SDR family NAD(P)-dependent oxidoreductase [Acidimicrobiales bacterium]